MGRGGILAGILGVMGLFTVPIVFLNTLGGIVSGIWLAILGEWWALGYGLALLLASTFGISFALLPGLLLGAPAVYFVSKGYKFLVYPFALLSSLYTVALITVWCVWVNLYLQYSDPRSFFPLLLWSYGTATGPWTWMASKERDNYASLISASAAQIGYILMMVMATFFKVTLMDLATAFGAVMVIALILQFTLAIQAEAKHAAGRADV